MAREPQKPREELRKAWEERYGRSYTPELQELWLLPTLLELERRNGLGRNILDVGSGLSFETGVSNLLDEGFGEKKVISLDWGASKSSEWNSNSFTLKHDAEKTGLNEISAKDLAKIRKFLGVTRSKKESAVIDAIVYSHVLNYLDYRRAIDGHLQFLKPGGRIIVLNSPSLGYKELFSNARPKNNSDLRNFLEFEKGMEIEHYAPLIGSKLGSKKPVGEKNLFLLIARKKA